jgi:uncharacterized phage protein (TIGR02218 family)
MLTIQPGPATLLMGRSLRLVSIWRVTRTDGTVYRFAAHDRPVVFREEDFLAYTYSPVEAFDPSSREMPNGLDDANLEVVGAIGSVITTQDLAAGLFRAAVVEEFTVDWRFPWAGFITSYYYTLESIRFTGEEWKGDLSGITRRLSQNEGRRHGRTCDADLGDSRCTVALGPFTYTGETPNSVSGTYPKQSFTIDNAAWSGFGDEWWTEGEVIWTGGGNAGQVSEVQSSLDIGSGSHELVLYLPLPVDIETSDTFTIITGCDKTASTCKAKFANLPNFRGFPTMPGTDKALQGP